MLSCGKIGKQDGTRRRFGETTEERHEEQTARKRWTSNEVSKCLAMSSSRSFGSRVQSTIAGDFLGK